MKHGAEIEKNGYKILEYEETDESNLLGTKDFEWYNIREEVE